MKLEKSMNGKSAKERVQDKFNLAKDAKDAKIKTSIQSIEKIDGKFKCDFSVDGLPQKKEGPYSDSYRRITKIFDNWEGLSDYAKDFFSKSDEEIVKLCKEA